MKKTIQTTYVGDGGYDNLMKSIEGGKQPFKYIDYLYVAFADLKPNSYPPQIYFKPEYETKVKAIISEAKKQNPSLIVFAQVNWAMYLAPLDTEAKIDAFAKSIPPFLKQYGFGGIDFEREQPPFRRDLASHLFIKVKEEIGEGVKLSISADTTEALDANVLNKYVDIVIVQSYERLQYIDNFISFGISPEKIYVGIASENDGGSFYPRGGGISDYITKCLVKDVAGLYGWRLDNDDVDHKENLPRYTITKQMWQFSKGTMAVDIGGNVFDDTDMDRNAKGNQQKVNTPITQLTVIYGDVLVAIQTTNGILKLPQHGGYSGVVSPPIILDVGDKIIKVTGHTGDWYGRKCVLQLTLTTKNGVTYGPYGKANSPQDIAFAYEAPAGQSIVAFKGTLINVPLKDAPDTTIIGSLSVSFA